VTKVSRLRSAVLISFLLAVTGLFDQRAAASPVRELIERADAVVIGTDTGRGKAGTLVSFFIDVQRVFKGNLKPGTLLPVQWDSGVEAPIWRNPPNSRKGVWFLRNNSGVWECIRARSGRVPAFSYLFYPVTDGPLPASLRHDTSLSPTDQIIIEIAVAESKRAHGIPVINEAAANHDSAEVRNAFRYLARLKSPRSRILGLDGLIQRGDVEGLLLFEAEHRKLPASPELAMIVRDIDVSFRNPDPVAIQALGRLAASASRIPGLQLAAARALSAIHTREAVRYLAPLLDDPDPKVSEMAAIGLSFFANGVGIQTIQGARLMEHLNYRTAVPYPGEDTERYLGFDERRRDEYLAFWKDWWGRHRADFPPVN